mmetsp:Transcript_42213/g.111827  ORF Transcript_42213/g.111827 Transcript_42213/m.111827 type:complete len:389 (+) Transcript_42213:438-1604(+)
MVEGDRLRAKVDGLPVEDPRGEDERERPLVILLRSPVALRRLLTVPLHSRGRVFGLVHHNRGAQLLCDRTGAHRTQLLHRQLRPNLCRPVRKVTGAQLRLRPLPNVEGSAARRDLVALDGQADLLAPHPDERLPDGRRQHIVRRPALNVRKQGFGGCDHLLQAGLGEGHDDDARPANLGHHRRERRRAHLGCRHGLRLEVSRQLALRSFTHREAVDYAAVVDGCGIQAEPTEASRPIPEELDLAIGVADSMLRELTDGGAATGKLCDLNAHERYISGGGVGVDASLGRKEGLVRLFGKVAGRCVGGLVWEVGDRLGEGRRRCADMDLYSRVGELHGGRRRLAIVAAAEDGVCREHRLQRRQQRLDIQRLLEEPHHRCGPAHAGDVERR